MNIIIITCPQLANQRLSVLIAQMKAAVTLGHISSMQIICMDDAESRRLVNARYCPERWASDIASGWEFFKDNIIAQAHKRDPNGIEKLYKLPPDVCFPSRNLTKSEHSVARRHIFAIQTIACANSPYIVLEDDALVFDELLFHELLKSFRDFPKKRVFFDLADNYISIPKEKVKLFKVGKLLYCKKSTAVTRTLLAYAIYPETAGILFSNLIYYSLPIDMQLQVLFQKLCIPGLSLTNSPFSHGSKTNAMPSSINQSC
jgi:hypothetical protein